MIIRWGVVFLAAIEGLLPGSIQASTLGNFVDALPAYPFKNIGEKIPEDRIVSWRSRSFLCPSTDGGASFPSKPSSQKPADAIKDGYVETCDDGDANLFNGLLCAADEEIGCETVRRSQVLSSGPHLGQWYRSPNRRWMGVNRCGDGESAVGVARYCTECINSLSPDHALGAILYLVIKRDTDAERRWFDWLDRNAQTTFLKDAAGRRQQFPWPRVCDLDRPSEQCIARSKAKAGGDVLGWHGGACFYLPTDIRDITYLSDISGVRLPPVTQNAVTASQATRALVAPLPSVALDDIAAHGDPKFPLHLQATRVLIRMIARNPSLRYENLPPMPSSPAMFASPLNEGATEDPYVIHREALNFARQDPDNAFFALLAYGPTPKVRSLIESRCPQPGGDPLGTREDWLWVKKGVPVHQSMGWDCVFVAKLYNKMRVKKDLWKELAEKLDPVNRLLTDAQALLKVAEDALVKTRTAAEQGAKALNDAHNTLTTLGSRVALESAAATLKAQRDTLARAAAVARDVKKKHDRKHPRNPAVDLAASQATQAAEAASALYGAAIAKLTEWDAARRLVDRELQTLEQKARDAAFAFAQKEVEKQTVNVNKVQTDYAQINRNIGVWGAD